jgi:hypothetical protein
MQGLPARLAHIFPNVSNRRRELPGDGSKGVPWTSTPTETECCRAAPTSAAWLERGRLGDG